MEWMCLCDDDGDDDAADDENVNDVQETGANLETARFRLAVSGFASSSCTS